MDITPQAVASATFRVGRKGYEPDEVRAFLATVARALSDAVDRGNHMETRARQAVARIQEMQAATAPRLPEGDKLDDTATISRTLLLAQKTADDTVAQARFDADQFRVSARAEAESIVADAHQYAAEIVEGARIDARKVADGEQLRAEAELQQLLIRLEYLRDDVHQLEDFTVTQRSRLLEASAALREVAERRVGGLGEIRTPTLRGAAPDDEPVGIYAPMHDSWPEDDSDPVPPPRTGPGAQLLAGGEFADSVGAIVRGEAVADGFPADTPGWRDEAEIDPTPLIASFPEPPVARASANADVYVDRARDEALAAVPDAPGLSFIDEITAEVPIFQRPPQPPGGMRILGD